MTDRFLPDYGLYLLNPGVRPETRLVFFDLPVDPLTRPALRTVSLTLHNVEATLGAVQQGRYERFAPLIVQQLITKATRFLASRFHQTQQQGLVRGPGRPGQ